MANLGLICSRNYVTLRSALGIFLKLAASVGVIEVQSAISEISHEIPLQGQMDNLGPIWDKN